MSKIISIGTAVPQHRTEQNVILEFMHAAYDNNIASRKLNALFTHSGINARYSVIPDFDKSKGEHIFFNGTPSTAKVNNRLNVFEEKAVPLAIEAIHNSFKKLDTSANTFGLTHLITVSCTGISSPGIDSALIEQLKLPNDIQHTSVNFIGCNAAFHALKMADAITKADAEAKVLIVCVELCTLHFQPKNDHDNLLSNTIFGDGAAAVIVTSDKYNHQQKSLTMNGFYSLLLNKGKHLMGWNVTPINFEMVLDTKIPEFIGDEIDSILKRASTKFNVLPETITNWAIHPGGKKIVDTIKERLKLTDEDMKHSYKVLQAYGNMSSPTILFVLNELMQAQYKKGETIFSMGFGPGLSIETALFSYA